MNRVALPEAVGLIQLQVVLLLWGQWSDLLTSVGSPVKVVKMILIFVFKSCFLGQSLVGHGLNWKNEEKVIGDRQKSRPRLKFVANPP